jgi:hypothetical protein
MWGICQFYKTFSVNFGNKNAPTSGKMKERQEEKKANRKRKT